MLESNPASERAHLWLSAAYAQVGREDDAEWEVEQVLATNPDVSVDSMRQLYPFTDPDDLAHLVDGLRKAGLADKSDRKGGQSFPAPKVRAPLEIADG